MDGAILNRVEARRTAKKMGEAACLRGLNIKDNPYPEGDDCRGAWTYGFSSEQRRIERVELFGLSPE